MANTPNSTPGGGDIRKLNTPGSAGGYGSTSGNASQAGQVGKPEANDDSLSSKVGSALNEGKAGLLDAATEVKGDLGEQLAQMRRDMAKMQETIGKFASDAGGQAAKTAQNVGNAVAGEVGAAAQQAIDAGSKMAADATSQVKTFASELEACAKRNPFGTLGATLIIGLVLGMMSRGRA